MAHSLAHFHRKTTHKYKKYSRSSSYWPTASMSCSDTLFRLAVPVRSPLALRRARPFPSCAPPSSPRSNGASFIVLALVVLALTVFVVSSRVCCGAVIVVCACVCSFSCTHRRYCCCCRGGKEARREKGPAWLFDHFRMNDFGSP